MLMIIDGNHLAHRCRHVFSLSNKGVDVSVTYGFLKVTQSLLSKFQPSSVIVCWDNGIPEFRREAIQSYKANRHLHDDPMEYEDFLRQMNELSNFVLPITGMLSVKALHTEADDLMYHASRMSIEDCIIVTGDSDLLQAVNDNVSVYNPISEKYFTPSVVEKEFGVKAGSFIHWKALQGDSSDNIPGVVGVGEKTATKLFKEYKEVTSIFNAALGHHPTKQIDGRLGESLRTFGLEKFSKNVFVMALYLDRTGSRLSLYQATQRWAPYNSKVFKTYLMKNAFVSLMLPTFYKCLNNLCLPDLSCDLKIPVIAPKRTPVK